MGEYTPFKMKGHSLPGPNSKSPSKFLGKMVKGLAKGTMDANSNQSAKESQDEEQGFDVDKNANKLDGNKASTQNKHTTCPAYGGKSPGGTAGSGKSQAQIRQEKTRGKSNLV